MNTSRLECGILIQYNEQNLKITERMQASGKWGTANHIVVALVLASKVIYYFASVVLL